ncbi:MAG: hypothetical protein AABZ00_12850 [Chloroflexota bacterium]
MNELCCASPSVGSDVCELPSSTIQRVSRAAIACPVCGEKGKPVQGQTVKALLSVTLHQMKNVEYLFCRASTCHVVYFTPDGKQTFDTQQVRERVFQKEPDADDVFVCYCFSHTAGEVRAASSETRAAIEGDIRTGIQAGQCACDLRNPQGSCCLGNVGGLIKQFEQDFPGA